MWPVTHVYSPWKFNCEIARMRLESSLVPHCTHDVAPDMSVTRDAPGYLWWPDLSLFSNSCKIISRTGVSMGQYSSNCCWVRQKRSIGEGEQNRHFDSSPIFCTPSGAKWLTISSMFKAHCLRALFIYLSENTLSCLKTKSTELRIFKEEYIPMGHGPWWMSSKVIHYTERGRDSAERTIAI